MQSSRLPIIIIADDLTGACDAAVPFAAAGDVVKVGMSDRAPDIGAPIRAMTTNTRDLPAAEAERRIRELAYDLAGDFELFKKVDSAFRGNTILEICAAVRHWRFDVAVLAPAYPALGRTVRDGVLRVDEGDAERTIAVEQMLEEAGVSIRSIAVGVEQEVPAVMLAAADEGTKVILCDAMAQSDLERAVQAARSLQKRILWIGSGGLAHALAEKGRSQAQVIRRRKGRVVFFIGSPHGVTSAQVACFNELPDAKTSEATVVSITMGRTTDGEVQQAFARVAPEQIGCIFMTGGDTALFVCRALGIESIRLEREFAPGVPIGTVEGGWLDRVTVVLKSGGFGEANLLCRLVEEFGAKQEVTV